MKKSKKVVLLTGTELRHEFFRKYLANHDDINILSSFCESKKGNLSELVQKNKNANNLRSLHLLEREVIENDFFGVFCYHIDDKSNPIFIEKGDINSSINVQKIIKHNPEIIISYGCSIINSELLNIFEGRFINIHLGLSPYYRGSGTNFWPFVNNELQFIGTTFMHIDSGIDTGEIIHQIRAKISINDNIHKIGNRLIKDSFTECVKLIRCFDEIKTVQTNSIKQAPKRYYRKKDFTEASLKVAYLNLSKGSIKNYLDKKSTIDNQFPILKNPIF